MGCTSCRSSNQAEFTTEMMMHFKGLENIDKPGVLAFATVLVCLDCGFSRFTTRETDLALLARRDKMTEASTQHGSVGAPRDKVNGHSSMRFLQRLSLNSRFHSGQ
jgi:hypothetical protein